MTAHVPSTIHAPILGRHGWQEVHCFALGGSTKSAPPECHGVGSHATWRDGFAGSNDTTPVGYHRTLFMVPSWCDHAPRRTPRSASLLDGGQGVLW
jgi:hypothetical protein